VTGTPLWRVKGWSAPPRNPRERRLLRSGGKEPTRRIGDRPPCRVCGSRLSRLRKDPRVKGGKTRQCVPCETRRARGYRSKRRAAWREYQRTWARRRRAEKRLAEVAA
jgi:hypothetical protein